MQRRELITALEEGRCQPVTTMLGPLPYVGGNSGDRRVD